MKKLLIPVVGAVVLGLCAGSGFAYVNAKQAALVHAVFVADSVAKFLKDSTAAADSVQKEAHAQQLAAAAEEIPLTPADSIRAAHNEPTTLKTETHGVPNAVEPKPRTTAPASKAGAESHAPASTGHETPPASTKPAPAEKHAPAAAPPAAATAHTPDAPVTEAIENALPERRIAKIFGAMQSKDAAKVLEQMSDNDIRVILGMMGDKQAAAILSALPPARAALISKGESGKNPPAGEEKKPGGARP